MAMVFHGRAFVGSLPHRQTAIGGHRMTCANPASPARAQRSVETYRAGLAAATGRGRARRLRGQEHFRRAAAAQGGRRHAGAAPGDALCRGHRQHRADQERRSRRARAGLPAIDRLPGRHLRQAGHPAVHDRARDLQAQARPGAGGRGRRAGLAPAGGSRLQAAESIWCSARRSRRRPRHLDIDPRQRPGQSPAGPGQHQARRGQLRLHQGNRAVRRHRQRASWSRSASSSASPPRPSSPPSSRWTRSR